MYERLEALFGVDKLNSLHKANILLVGVGGVGSFCFETLIRSGIKNITICDFDVYELSNLNRQLHSNNEVLGENKTNILYNYAEKINPDIKVNIINKRLDENAKLDFRSYDYIIDACDSIPAKIMLCEKAAEEGIPFICSMGVGNRRNPEALKITFLDKTQNDPLAKKMRSELRKRGFNQKVKVVASEELPIKKTPVSSYIGVSSVAGILLADAVIKDLIHERN